ncbi:MAG: DUF938 domain-containing protein [Alphaproteobacteria bacterium]
MSNAIDAPATWRNREAILAVLERVLPKSGLVLEVASGTGQHAAFLAPRLAPLDWQPSDVESSLFDSIVAWSGQAAVENSWVPKPPIVVDAMAAEWPIGHADAIVCINMIHIAPTAAATGLLAGAGRLLAAGGVLYLYGPFMRGGVHSASSNRDFDLSLRRQDSRWGVRDLDHIVAEAADHGLELQETVDMPANNLSVVFRRSAVVA